MIGRVLVFPSTRTYSPCAAAASFLAVCLSSRSDGERGLETGCVALFSDFAIGHLFPAGVTQQPLPDPSRRVLGVRGSVPSLLGARFFVLSHLTTTTTTTLLSASLLTLTFRLVSDAEDGGGREETRAKVEEEGVE